MADEITESMLKASSKLLSKTLPRIEPLRQERLFLAVGVALEQVQYALHLIELSQQKSTVIHFRQEICFICRKTKEQCKGHYRLSGHANTDTDKK